MTEVLYHGASARADMCWLSDGLSGRRAGVLDRPRWSGAAGTPGARSGRRGREGQAWARRVGSSTLSRCCAGKGGIGQGIPHIQSK